MRSRCSRKNDVRLAELAHEFHGPWFAIRPACLSRRRRSGWHWAAWSRGLVGLPEESARSPMPSRPRSCRGAEVGCSHNKYWHRPVCNEKVSRRAAVAGWAGLPVARRRPDRGHRWRSWSTDRPDSSVRWYRGVACARVQTGYPVLTMRSAMMIWASIAAAGRSVVGSLSWCTRRIMTMFANWVLLSPAGLAADRRRARGVGARPSDKRHGSASAISLGRRTCSRSSSVSRCWWASTTPWLRYARAQRAGTGPAEEHVPAGAAWSGFLSLNVDAITSASTASRCALILLTTLITIPCSSSSSAWGSVDRAASPRSTSLPS